MKQHISKVKQRIEIFDHFFLSDQTLTHLGFKKFFGSLFTKVAYNKEYNDYTILNKEFHEIFDYIDKTMFDYFYLRKPNFAKRQYTSYNFELERLKKLALSVFKFDIFDNFKLLGNISNVFFSNILLSSSEKKYFSKYKENPEKAIFYAFFEPIFDGIKKIYEFETKELNFRIKTIPAIFKFSYLHSLSEEHFYSFYLLNNKNRLNCFKTRDKDYFEIATN